MDVSTFVPDSWLSRALDTAGGILLFMLKGTHRKFEEQVKVVQDLVTEHAVFKTNVTNLTNDISEVKDNTQEIMKILMRRG